MRTAQGLSSRPLSDRVTLAAHACVAYVPGLGAGYPRRLVDGLDILVIDEIAYHAGPDRVALLDYYAAGVSTRLATAGALLTE